MVSIQLNIVTRPTYPHTFIYETSLYNIPLSQSQWPPTPTESWLQGI